MVDNLNGHRIDPFKITEVAAVGSVVLTSVESLMGSLKVATREYSSGAHDLATAFLFDLPLSVSVLNLHLSTHPGIQHSRSHQGLSLAEGALIATASSAFRTGDPKLMSFGVLLSMGSALVGITQAFILADRASIANNRASIKEYRDPKFTEALGRVVD